MNVCIRRIRIVRSSPRKAGGSGSIIIVRTLKGADVDLRHEILYERAAMYNDIVWT